MRRLFDTFRQQVTHVNDTDADFVLEPKYKPGDLVLVRIKERRTGISRHLLTTWHGPYKVLANLGDSRTYRLDLPDHLRVHPVFHEGDLRSYIPRDDPVPVDPPDRPDMDLPPHDPLDPPGPQVPPSPDRPHDDAVMDEPEPPVNRRRSREPDTPVLTRHVRQRSVSPDLTADVPRPVVHHPVVQQRASSSSSAQAQTPSPPPRRPDPVDFVQRPSPPPPPPRPAPGTPSDVPVGGPSPRPAQVGPPPPPPRVYRPPPRTPAIDIDDEWWREAPPAPVRLRRRRTEPLPTPTSHNYDDCMEPPSSPSAASTSSSQHTTPRHRPGPERRRQPSARFHALPRQPRRDRRNYCESAEAPPTSVYQPELDPNLQHGPQPDTEVAQQLIFDPSDLDAVTSDAAIMAFNPWDELPTLQTRLPVGCVHPRVRSYAIQHFRSAVPLAPTVFDEAC